MLLKTYKVSLLLISALIGSLPSWQAQAQPWGLGQALDLPKWLSVTGEHRSRFENLDEQYRGTRTGGDQVLVFRTLVRGEFDFDRIKFVGEMIDARSRLADSGTPLSTSVINPTDLLQAYVEIPIDDLLIDGNQSHLKLGRLTMDMGSRRLLARNRFRNTINNFTGIDWQLRGVNNQQFRAFYTLPVQRLVDGNPLDNQAAFDKQDEEVMFWGLYYRSKKTLWNDIGEFYFLGLDERDSPGRPTADRQLYTTGFRFYCKAAKEQFDYQLESVFQFGESRASSTSTIDLDHKAHFQHIELGYSFNARWSPRLIAQYDYASGDDDPGDGENNRFSTLFGARRFDFGPTSIYGPFARSNISSPGLRLKLKPTTHTSSFLALRAFWLASSNDAWTTAKISNAAGVDDSYIGSQIEARLRWDIAPDNIRIEAGAAYLFAGDIMDNAEKDNSTYLYSQVIFKF